MTVLPAAAVPARATPVFHRDSTPPALLKDHHTTVWAQLVVQSGSVEFTESNTGRNEIAHPDQPVTIVPNEPHHIVPSADAEFFVQFYEVPES